MTLEEKYNYKKLIALIMLSNQCYAQEIFFVPSEIICATADIRSCFISDGDLSNWEMKNLDEIKIGKYQLKYESLIASAPNNPYFLPVKLTYKNGNHHIEMNYKIVCVKAFMQLADSWKVEHKIAYCTGNQVSQCPLIRY